MFKFSCSRNMYEEQDIEEDILNLKKKNRTATQAAQAAIDAAPLGFNPFEALYKRHKEAKAAALKVFKDEMRQAVDEVNKVTMSTNFIKDKSFVMPKSTPDGVFLLIGMHVYLAGKKGFWERAWDGSPKNWFTSGVMLGVKALQIYVAKFAGKAFAKQINKKNVFNGSGEGENEGKVSYYCALKVPQGNS